MRKLNTLFLVMLSSMLHANQLGENTYQIACKNCHSPKLAVAIKAPAAFDTKAWNKRFDNAEQESKSNPTQFKTPIDYLVYNVKIGKGLMYHGGLCNESDEPNKNCSDEAFTQAIYYMSDRKAAAE